MEWWRTEVQLTVSCQPSGAVVHLCAAVSPQAVIHLQGEDRRRGGGGRRRPLVGQQSQGAAVRTTGQSHGDASRAGHSGHLQEMSELLG